jgi:hypothetical protein
MKRRAAHEAAFLLHPTAPKLRKSGAKIRRIQLLKEYFPKRTCLYNETV